MVGVIASLSNVTQGNQSYEISAFSDKKDGVVEGKSCRRKKYLSAFVVSRPTPSGSTLAHAAVDNLRIVSS